MGVSSGDVEFGMVNKTGGNKTVTLTVDQMPKHSHKVGYAASEVSGTSVPYVDRHNLIYSPNNMYPSTSDAGGNKEHSNIQPYITCYMWKRTT